MAPPTIPMDLHAQPPSSKGGPAPSSARHDAKGERRALERDLSKVDGRKWLRRLGILVGLAALVAGLAFWRIKTRPPPPPRYVTATTSKGDVVETIQSTGQVQPLLQ